MVVAGEADVAGMDIAAGVSARGVATADVAAGVGVITEVAAIAT